jgi:hypothetical protein
MSCADYAQLLKTLCLAMVAMLFAWLLPEQAREKSALIHIDEYRRTSNALVRYRVLAAEDDGAVLPETERPVKPGDHYDGVPRLATTGMACDGWG